MMYTTYLQAKQQLNSLESIDYFFAKQISQYLLVDNDISSEEQSLLFHILMGLQLYYRGGHTCLPLSNIAGSTLWNTEDIDDTSEDIVGYTFPSKKVLVELILKLKLRDKTPICYKYKCLYINKLWLFEIEIAKNISSRSIISTQGLDIEKTVSVLNKLFDKEETINWQKIAVAKSLIRNFSIISGGPGTGKTTTVAKLILALQSLSKINLDIQLVAPTGKAAQRLRESITSSKVIIKNVDTSALPDEAKTLHRFLGIMPNSRYIKYNREHKSPCDVLIVDEASMIDINMFINIIRAIKDDCKLILLGDTNQLPSVETGNILAEFAKACDKNKYNQETISFIEKTCAYNLDKSSSMYDFITFLQKSYRTESQDILRLASNVIEGNTDIVGSQSVVYNPISSSIVFTQQVDKFIEYVCDKYISNIAKAKSPKEALDYLKDFRILVGNKNIDIGTYKLNQKIEVQLGKVTGTNYNGRPIMVVENNYSTKLFNGDVGVIWSDKAYFENSEGGLREIGITRLPKVETVYVMTIHKTQGSEFNNIAIFLPEDHNQLLSRELLYTGITRAKDKVYVVATKKVWDLTVNKKISRFSNIHQILVDSSNTIIGEL